MRLLESVGILSKTRFSFFQTNTFHLWLFTRTFLCRNFVNTYTSFRNLLNITRTTSYKSQLLPELYADAKQYPFTRATLLVIPSLVQNVSGKTLWYESPEVTITFKHHKTRSGCFGPKFLHMPTQHCNFVNTYTTLWEPSIHYMRGDK